MEIKRCTTKRGLKHINTEIYKSAKELFLILWLLTAIANFLNNIFINKFCEMSKMSELILIRVVKCLAKKVSGVFIIDVYRLHTWINSALQEWNWRIIRKFHYLGETISVMYKVILRKINRQASIWNLPHSWSFNDFN